MKFCELEKLVLKEGQSLADYLAVERIECFSAAIVSYYEITELITHGLSQNSAEQIMFQSASMSKPVFAFTLMRLYEMGLVDIDENLIPLIEKLLPWLKCPNGTTITYKELLNHTSGLNVGGFAGYLHQQKIPSLSQILYGDRPANSPRLEFAYPPKTKFAYSGGAYTLAQFLLEHQTNKPYEQWVGELVLKPLKMTSSVVSSNQLDIDMNRIAIGWSWHDTPLNHGYVIYPQLAAAGLWTTPYDLALFGIECMKALHGKSLLLSKKMAELMMKTPADVQSDYGPGFRIVKKENHYLFGHQGDNIGYHGIMYFNPSKGSGTVIMVNSDIGDTIPRQMMDTNITNNLL